MWYIGLLLLDLVCCSSPTIKCMKSTKAVASEQARKREKGTILRPKGDEGGVISPGRAWEPEVCKRVRM